MSPQTTQQYYLTKVGSYKNFEIREVPVPQPKANEVLVKVHAVSLQYRDYAIATGSYNIGVQEDIVPCSDMAGEVISVGVDVKDWKAGDRVCANFATDHLSGPPTAEIAPDLSRWPGSWCTDTSTGRSLHTIPSHLTYAQAATLPCAALTAYNGLLGGANPLKAGDTVLVQGTGGVSIFALQFAVASGATVIATSSSDEKLKLVQKWGAKHLINYRTTPDWEKEVLRITNGKGVDHVVEVGGAGTFAKSLASVRYGGNIALIGFVTGGDSRSDIIIPVFSKAIDVRGIYIGSVAQFKDMIRLIEANPEKTIPVVDKVFPFEDAVGAYAHLESQKHVGKVVIEVAKA
ncbi:hypothetical protein NMY22_g14734 [Coprinellus aureogranulatus]|nr:hypothetical protein NMY22_g14734 [Coprinellus aureogranulatus]